MHPGIKLRHLRLFLDILTEGSLTAAARRQGITQPAASRSLAELETLLGQPLFLRQGRDLTLTPEGAIFARHARTGLQSLDSAAASMGGSQRQGRLRVGVLPTAMTRLFPAAALRFHALRPEVLISVRSGPQDYLLRQLQDGALDMLIGRMPSGAEMSALRFDHLYDDPVVLVMRAGHPLTDAPVTRVLTEAPLILPPEGAVIRAMVDAYLTSLGLTRRPAFETATLTLGRALVQGSDAVWFISRAVVLDDLTAGRLQALPLGAAYLAGAVGATRRAAALATGPELDLLCDLLRSEPQASG
ncbi:MAG: LysR substrate-binding domain-containing protein [Paracoccus sp. (in: a-proteobacteria)]|uniref:LysR substrate-binding domain-containing protein n=1 Tax=Paracoccus sp. TaxID=267 RepID=UPI0026DF6F99|nr:LysR substrate-binding domain-containing protein [Paracoccus sp. (in: a-proteobacteria)]MDO5620313.1 LysR substrate-binding domain-containing protein [Paracoccus sp. (in: a-proteobacteria)]